MKGSAGSELIGNDELPRPIYIADLSFAGVTDTSDRRKSFGERSGFGYAIGKRNHSLPGLINISGGEISIDRQSYGGKPFRKRFHPPILGIHRPVAFNIDKAPILTLTCRGQAFHEIFFGEPTDVECWRDYNFPMCIDITGLVVLLKAKKRCVRTTVFLITALAENH